jgi:hypothetical protein
MPDLDFDPDRKCIKCGSLGPAKTEYRDKKYLGSGGAIPERLDRICSRCGFVWSEKCIDASSDCSCAFSRNPGCKVHGSTERK